MKNRIINDINELLSLEGSNHNKTVEFEYNYGSIIVFVTGELYSYFKNEVVFETKTEEVLQSWQLSNIEIEIYSTDGDKILKLENIFNKIDA